MANYPHPPGHRMAYDRDGSVVLIITGGTPSQQSSTVAVHLNDEDSVGGIESGTPVFQIAVLFPQLRDLAAYWVLASQYPISPWTASALETSPDTTTGVDGTWTSRAAPFLYTDSSVATPYYRNSIRQLSVAGIKAVRFTFSQTGGYDANVFGLHLYGDISAGSEGDCLQLWDPAIDQRIAAAALDFGDVPRSNVSQKQFRLKNRSATKTANSVVVGLEALTDATPSLGSQHQFSLDGSTWASTVTVTAIAPGAISPIVYVRRSTDAAAALSVWAARITAVAGSWT